MAAADELSPEAQPSPPGLIRARLGTDILTAVPRGLALLSGVTGIVMAGCQGPVHAPDALVSTVRDSAGVRIVENEAPAPASRLPWVIGSGPSVSVGALDGDAPYQLFGVEDAMRLADGRILIANSGTSEVRVFDEAGVFIESWGREGEGPGEFVSLTDLMEWPGDSVMAWDFGQDRLTLFDQAGGLGRTFSPLLGPDLEPGSAVGVLPDGTILTAGRVPWAGQEPVTGLVRRSREYALVDRSGQDRVDLGLHPDEEYFIKGERLAIMRHPFRRLNHTEVWGARAIIAPSDRYEIRGYGEDGALEVLVRRAHTLRPVTQADLDAHLAGRVAESDPAERSALGQLFDGFPLVESFPAFSHVLVDTTGDLWVKEYARPGDDRSVWTVFDGEGRVRGLVETPPGLLLYEIGPDYLLGRATGELDVERVELWSLARSEG